MCFNAQLLTNRAGTWKTLKPHWCLYPCVPVVESSLTQICRYLSTLGNHSLCPSQVQPPFLNKPVYKESHKSGKQIYSVWPHWEEGQKIQGPLPPSLSSGHLLLKHHQSLNEGRGYAHLSIPTGCSSTHHRPIIIWVSDLP